MKKAAKPDFIEEAVQFHENRHVEPRVSNPWRKRQHGDRIVAGEFHQRIRDAGEKIQESERQVCVMLALNPES